jgi:hypothetical protein
VAILRELSIGEVSVPFETVFGWEILRRTANRARAEYAMAAVELPFDVGSALPPDATSPESARALATEFAQILRARPDRFDELQSRGCCKSVVQWSEGRGPGELMRVLQSLEVGQIAPGAVRLGLSYVVPKRVLAGPAAEVTARFELPSPTEPDLTFLFRSLDDDFLAEQLSDIRARAVTALDLSDGARDRLSKFQTSVLGVAPPGSPLLGSQGYDRYLAIVKRQFEAAILQAPSDG